MLTLQEKIAHSLKLGGKLIFISEDEINRNCPLVKDPQNWVGLPFLLAQSLNKQLWESLTSEKDWLFSSGGELQVILKSTPALQAARVVVDSKMDADSVELNRGVFGVSTVESFQIDEILKTEDFEGESFWAEVRDLFYSVEKVPEVKSSHQKPCLFLDRDDVVIKDVPYATDSSKVELLPGISGLIKEAHAKGYWVALVTNQSGLGRGWIDWVQYQAVHQRMLELLAEDKAYFDDYQFSSYIGDSDLPYGDLLPSLRKPRAGMFHRVQEKLKADIQSSVMIGDSATDLIAAFSFGLRRLFLLRSHKTDKQLEVLRAYQEQYCDFKYEVITDLKKVLL